MYGLLDLEIIVIYVKCFDFNSLSIYVIFKEIIVIICIIVVVNIKIRILLEVLNLILYLKYLMGIDVCFWKYLEYVFIFSVCLERVECFY